MHCYGAQCSYVFMIRNGIIGYTNNHYENMSWNSTHSHNVRDNADVEVYRKYINWFVP